MILSNMIYLITKLIMLNNLEKLMNSSRDNYIYLKDIARYYWIEKQKFFSWADVCSNLMITQAKLKEYRQSWKIKDYDSICYRKWWKSYCYNLLSEEDILSPSNTPKLDSCIEDLITSISWNKDENIEYLYKAILYKYTHLNDYSIPAIVFYWVWWSWKSSFITLLSTIFWEKNIMWNLWQRDISSSFDSYKGQRLIVEYAEITTNNTHWDMMVLNKLKNIIWAEKITVNEKWVQPYQIDNIAWFFISSNSNKPLQLDDKDKGNRRFTIMKSISKLNNWKDINEAIRDKRKVSNFLAWLKEMYPKVIEYKSLNTLDNEDKKDLEERSQNEANNFWDWLKENYPNFIWKKRVTVIKDKMFEYCSENDIDLYKFNKYFWNNSKYPKKKIRFNDKVYAWVNIE